MLTGLRRTEASLIEKQWLSKQSDFWVLSLPAHVCKNGRALCLPLGATSAALLTKLMPEQSSASSRMFSARTDTSKAFTRWSKSKLDLDDLSGVTDWTLHDLRRTYAVSLQRCGANLQTIEKLLHHVSGSFAGSSAPIKDTISNPRCVLQCSVTTNGFAPISSMHELDFSYCLL
jgi:integrase